MFTHKHRLFYELCTIKHYAIQGNVCIRIILFKVLSEQNSVICDFVLKFFQCCFETFFDKWEIVMHLIVKKHRDCRKRVAKVYKESLLKDNGRNSTIGLITGECGLWKH
jgi:hypothetical protein